MGAFCNNMLAVYIINQKGIILNRFYQNRDMKNGTVVHFVNKGGENWRLQNDDAWIFISCDILLCVYICMPVCMKSENRISSYLFIALMLYLLDLTIFHSKQTSLRRASKYLNLNKSLLNYSFRNLFCVVNLLKF